ncbi:hypothetical protein ERO13_D07G104500v2 [Gossypium hirsutum]|uniref:Low-temperature-induced 65 kDa protein-like n=2 Tax=Gossypium TaxID=3633 RepID=A0ABM3AF54_GOSHI|nr:uncharacterized protein LOC107956022 [Gossypium hirsutum]KAG4137949.1 hypothetical protein ERO13_D07G104500v2 [Gossypium hirsutum]TYH62373.1 hypothetical protein ES332_D07G116700v1 [Gossypium tomentosum]
MHRNAHESSGATLLPTVDQLHPVKDGQTWSPPSCGRSQEVQHHSRKSTVLSKVKEKARRWRNNFRKKRHNHGDTNSTSCAVRLEEDDDKYQDEHPEYLGAPMYESELAPEAYKEHAKQNPRAVLVISEKHVLTSSVKAVSEADHVTEKHASRSDDGALNPGENKWDKGVSVKEYIMHKLEPGEDEKALSQVISDAMHPAADAGVMGKMKVAVNSLLGREDHPPQATTISQTAMEEENKGRILQTN